MLKCRRLKIVEFFLMAFQRCGDGIIKIVLKFYC